MSDSKKGALIFSHIQAEGSSNIGRALRKRDIRVKTISTPSTNLDDIDPLRPDLLVVMGGPVGVYQQDEYPFLKDEIDIIKARLDADKPIIGICLGSQLMAAALGEKVFKGPQGKELGWSPLTLTDAGKNNEAAHLCGSKTNMFHWHGDTYDLPKGCTRLASSEKYENQIYQVGTNGLGFQCHPEVTTAQLNEWAVMFVNEVTGEDVVMPLADLRAENEKYIDTLKNQADLFFNEWLESRGL